MDIKDIKILVKLVNDSKLTGLEFSDGKYSLVLKKEVEVKNYHHADVVTMTSPREDASEITEKIEEIEIKGTQVKAPLVGTYYIASGPDIEPFVKVGQTVSEGQVICIVEAMKVMNEIKSPVSGTVKKIYVTNEQLVEFEQLLMVIE